MSMGRQAYITCVYFPFLGTYYVTTMHATLLLERSTHLEIRGHNKIKKMHNEILISQITTHLSTHAML